VFVVRLATVAPPVECLPVQPTGESIAVHAAYGVRVIGYPSFNMASLQYLLMTRETSHDEDVVKLCMMLTD